MNDRVINLAAVLASPNTDLIVQERAIPLTGPGEILIRDLAMWHRGTPNPTTEPRTMLTLGFFRGDYYYGYGETAANVDEESFPQLHPRIQRMFAHHFSLKSSLKRKRTAAKKWLKARLKPLRAAS